MTKLNSSRLLAIKLFSFILKNSRPYCISQPRLISAIYHSWSVSLDTFSFAISRTFKDIAKYLNAWNNSSYKKGRSILPRLHDLSVSCFSVLRYARHLYAVSRVCMKSRTHLNHTHVTLTKRVCAFSSYRQILRKFFCRHCLVRQ